MTPREKALEAALKDAYRMVKHNETVLEWYGWVEAGEIRKVSEQTRTALAMPSEPEPPKETTSE